MPPFRLLLLEDNEGDARLVQLALADHAPGDFTVTGVERLADALARIQTEHFDVVLSDLGLPDSAGLATAQAIVGQSPALPLVVLTGSHDEDLGRAAIQHGAQDYLVKDNSSGPVIARTLRYAIERKRLEIGLRAASESLERRVAERTADLEAVIKKLRESEDRYRDLVENSQDLICTHDLEGKLLSVNVAAVRLTGYAQEALLRMNMADLLTRGARDGFAAYLNEIRTTGAACGVMRIRTAGGETRWWEYNNTLRTQGVAAPVVRGMAQDITERKRAEALLGESEERLRTIFEGVLDGILVVDAESKKFVTGNPAICRMLGYALDEIVRLSVPDIHSQQDLPRVMEEFERQRRGESQIAADIPVMRKDGSVFYADIKTASIRLDGRNCLLGIFRDITERKVMEQGLRDSITFRELLLQAMPLPVFYKDASGRYTGCNNAFAEFIGKTRNDIVGRTVYQVAPQSFAQTYRDKDLELLDDPVGAQVYESHVMHGDGTAHDVIFNKARVVDDAGRPTGIIGVITDITERKQAEEALRAAEEQFRGLVEQSLAGTYLIQDGRFAYVNPRLAEILGYESAGELIGCDPLSIVAGKDRGAVAESMRLRLAGERQVLSYSFTALRMDGSTTEVGLHSARATHGGRPAIIGLLQDISEKKRAEEQIQGYVKQLESAFMSTVEVATTLSEMRDPYTGGHVRRVAEIAVAIGAELGFDARRVEGLRVAGYLHDVGKITVPSEILSKPGKLSPVEFKLIQGHAQASYDVLKDVAFPWPVAQVALQHHERMDGSGYPQGLKGEAIVLEARIMAVADVVEAMSSHRPYRPALGIDQALAEIERGRGSAYDPVVADACLRLFREKGNAIPI